MLCGIQRIEKEEGVMLVRDAGLCFSNNQPEISGKIYKGFSVPAGSPTSLL